MIDPVGDRDFYGFVAEAGVAYAVEVRVEGFSAFDPALRVWDASGALLAASDMLPYGLHGTSPGVLVRSPAGGPTYLEVLDRGDWLGGVAFGAPDATYEIEVAVCDRIEPNEARGNDTLDQAAANAEAGLYDWYLDPWESRERFVIGQADAVGDVDTLSVTFAEDEVPVAWQVSAVPVAVSTYRMRMSLYDESGQRVASTSDPFWGIAGITFFDAGITFPITKPGRYSLQVDDELGGSGVGDWYALMAVYAPLAEAQGHTLGAPEVADEAVALDLRETEGSGQRAYAQTFYGWLEDFDGTPDPWDAFVLGVDDGAVEGALLTVRLETAAAGSALDARLSVYSADGTLVRESTVEPSGLYADDPAIIQLPLAEDGPLLLRIDPEDGAYGPDAFYLGTVRLSAP